VTQHHSSMPAVSRRAVLATATAAIAAPRLSLAQGANVMRFIPQIDLSTIDPHGSLAYVTRGHSQMVFDTLYGLDETMAPQPQMVEGHTVENDGTLWTLRLRDRLRFHDGTPVLARDAEASIRRFATRDGFGQAQETVLTLKQEGDKITGTISSFGGDSPISDAKLANGELSFKVTRDFGGGTPITTLYTGKIDGDSFKGKQQTIIEQTFEGKRSK